MFPNEFLSHGNQCQNSHESSVVHLSQMTLPGQQHNPSHPLKRNEWNAEKDPSDPLDNGTHCHAFSASTGPHGTPGGDEGCPPDDHYGGCSDISSSSEFGRRCRHN